MYFFWIDVFLLTSVLFPLYIDLIQRSDDEGNGPEMSRGAVSQLHFSPKGTKNEHSSLFSYDTNGLVDASQPGHARSCGQETS